MLFAPSSLATSSSHLLSWRLEGDLPVGWWRAAVFEVEFGKFFLPGGRGLLVGYHVRLGRSSALETQRMLKNFLVFLGVLFLLLVPHCLWETSGAIS